MRNGLTVACLSLVVIVGIIGGEYVGLMYAVTVSVVIAGRDLLGVHGNHREIILHPLTLLLVGLGLFGLLGMVRYRKNEQRVMKFTMMFFLLAAMVGISSPAFGVNDFNIGEIPPQTAWHGMTLEFQVHSEELGAEAALLINVIGSPNGPIGFDASGGLFSYTPDPQDKTPFSVTFKATSGAKTVSQTIPITPVPDLPPEHEVFGLEPVHRIPDPEDNKDYLIRTEIVSEAPDNMNYNFERKNDSTLHTRIISISGKTVVFEEEHSHGLYDDYNGWEDIKEMHIYAERVIIRSPLDLPQTNVTIYARELRFEGSGSISTTPKHIDTSPDQFEDGLPGLKAGDITLYIESFHSDAGTDTRFILTGGRGQDGGPGQDGVPQSLEFLEGHDMVPYSDCGNDCPFGSGIPWPDQTVFFVYEHPHQEIAWGTRSWPRDGTDAVAGGKPGDGGDGGDLTSTISVSGYADLQGGEAGFPSEEEKIYKGGRAGTPTHAYWIIKWYPKPFWEIDSEHVSQKGSDATSDPAENPIGQEGTFSTIDHQFSWFSPYALRMILAHAKDTYLYGHLEETEEILVEYLDLLDRYQDSAAWNTVSEQWQLEFGQMHEEMGTLQHLIESNLDYFGNPAGWVPMLSFEVNQAAFKQEIEHAIQVLYLAYWIKNRATDIQAKVDALEIAREKANQDVQEFKGAFEETMKLLPGLQDKSATLSNQREYLQDQLEQREQELLQRAQQIVEERHKVPWWKKALRTLGTALALSTIGQPFRGTVGVGLGLLSNPNPETLWDLILQIKDIPNANVFENYQKECKKLSKAFKEIPLSLSGDSIKQYTVEVGKAAKLVATQLKTYRAIFKETQIPKSELEQELVKLKESDPEFQELTQKVETFKAQQEQFARQIIQVQQTLSTLSDNIAHNLLAIDGMNRDIAAGNAVFFPRAMMYLDGMERRAKERLLKYHYWMAKALEYRTLESYKGELNLTKLFEQFATITSVNGELTPTDFEVLEALYTEQLVSIAEAILEDYNSNQNLNEFSMVTYFSFGQDQELLDALNNNEAITLNFMEELLFPASQEAIRLVKLEIDTMDVHLEGGGSVGSFGDLILSMAHAGLSTLAKGGAVYRFTHYNEKTENPIIWRTSYNALTGDLIQHELSDAGQSLLRALLLDLTDDEVMLFSRPAGWADIVFYKEVNTETEVDIVIDNLLLKVEYDYFDKPSDLVTLHVGALEEDLRPLFVLDQPDNNGLQDGVGNFYRTYFKNSTVTIDAPPRYGLWKFEKWVDRYGNDLGTDRSLEVSLSDDQFVRAHFVEEPGSSEINVKQGDMDIAPESMYEFGYIAPGSKKTVTFTIENPGTDPFSLYTIDLAASQFSVDPTENLPFTIAPNGSTTFDITYEPDEAGDITYEPDEAGDITYEPDEAGLHAATVSIPNNEPGTNPFIFTVASTENLLCDPGFDESTNPGGFPNSGCWLPSWLGQAGSVVTGFARSGRYSLHVYTGSAGSHYFSRPYHTDTDVVYTQGKQYRAGAYIKTPAGYAWQPTSSAFIRVSYKDSDGSGIAHYDSPHYLTANSEYELYEVTAPPAPPGTAYVGFAIFLQKPEGLSGQSIINVDDCFLQIVELPSGHITAGDDMTTTMENTPVTIDVLSNDSDENGDELTIDSVTQGSYGTVVNTATDILYTPQQIFHGTDNFQYTVTDGNGNYATAWVTVTVEADPNNLLCDNAFDQSTNPGEFPNSGCWLPSWLGTAGSEINEFYRSPPNSLHIYTGNPGTDYFSRPEHTDVTYTPGKQYRARAFIKTPAGFDWQPTSSAFIRLSYKDSDGSGIAHYDSPPYTTANANWELYEVTAPSAPPGTAYVGFAIFLQKPEGVVGQSIINVDDCFLEALEQPPALGFEPELLDFGAVNANMTAKVTNIGGDTLDWSITDPDYNWINVNPTSGSLLSGQSKHVTITIDRTSLKPGTEHTTAITVNAPDIEDTQDIAVYMSVPRTVPTQPSIVTTNGTQLMVQKRLFNDQLGFPKAYTIKGFAWSPGSTDSVVDIAVRKQAIFDWHAYDLGMMKGANANTVYLYLDPGLDPSKYSQILDTMYKNNIMAIMTVDEGINNVTNITKVVNAYKDHPAVLMWALGNEWNMNLYHGKYSTVQKAAEATEQAAQLIKTLDTNHPVAATYADISIAQTPSTDTVVNTICPSVDVWGLNIYRGYDFYDLFTEWAAITSKPMFLSEFGIDSFYTTDYASDSIAGYIDEQKQADWNHRLWLDLSSKLSADNSSKVCVGGTYFEWNDEWWKAGSPGVHSTGGWNLPAFPDAFSNEEYYGAVRIDENIRMPKLTYYTIKEDFWEENNPPTIQILQPDGIDDLENTSYTITWTDADLDDNASIALYYNTNNTDENGTLIVGSISEDDQTDAYIWDVSQVPEGDYYVYAIIDDGVNPSVASYSSGPVTIDGVGPAALPAYLLWTHTDETAALWTLDANGTVVNAQNCGPFAGWTAHHYHHTSDGTAHVLWTHTDGTAVVWTLNASGDVVSDWPYGPYAGWTARHYHCTSDGTTRLLWTHTDGRAAVWTLNASGTVVGAPTYGPYAGWAVRHYHHTSDGTTRLLWTHTDGTVALWTLNASGAVVSAWTYGPYAGWTVRHYHHTSDGTVQLLWTHSDGRAALWTLNASGTVVSDWHYGPFPGWTARHSHHHSDGTAHVLWTHTDGRAVLWTLNASGDVVSDWHYGPFDEGNWTAVECHCAVSALPASLLGPAGNAVIIRKTGSGTGTIIADDRQCGLGCGELSVPYVEHGTVTLQVIPDARSTFVRWETTDGRPIAGLHYAQPGDTVIAVFEKTP